MIVYDVLSRPMGTMKLGVTYVGAWKRRIARRRCSQWISF